MGLSSSKTTTGPSKQALPFIKSASSAVQGAYDANQGNLATIGQGLSSAFGDYSGSIGQNLQPAQDYYASVLGGTPGTNPQLDAIIDRTNGNVADQVNALFSKSGQTGSSRQIGELGKQLSDNESTLRYNDYTDQQKRMMTAAAGVGGLDAARNQDYATLGSLGTTAAGTPYLGASFLANGLGSLWGNSTTTKSSPSLGQMLLQGASNAAAAYAGGM